MVESEEIVWALSVECAALLGKVGEGTSFTITEDLANDFHNRHTGIDATIEKVEEKDGDYFYWIYFDCGCKALYPEKCLEAIK